MENRPAPPICNLCTGNHELTVIHILIECDYLKDIRRRHYQVTNLKQLIDTVSTKRILDFVKDIDNVLGRGAGVTIESLGLGEEEEGEHQEEDSHHCGKCQKVFLTLESYMKHKLQEHQYKVRYIRSATRGRVLLPHLVSKGNPIVAHASDQAKRKAEGAPKRSYVKRPKPSPEAEPLVPPSYNCQQCGKGFRREAALRRHLEFDHRAKSDSEDEEEDEVSVKADPDALDPDVYQPPSHQSHHAISGREQIIQKASAGNTVSNEPRPHACPHCRQTFKVAAVLRAHMLTHTDQRDYICSWEGCTYAFKTKGSLKRHMRRHTGERPFKCDLCLRSFGESGALQRHLKARTSCINKSDADLPRYGKKLDLLPQYRLPTSTADRAAAAAAAAEQQAGELTMSGSDLQEVDPTALMDIGNTVVIVASGQNLQCKACNSVFQSQSELRDHLQEHLVHLPYRCTLCSFATGRQQDLDLHSANAHGVAGDGPQPICIEQSMTETIDQPDGHEDANMNGDQTVAFNDTSGVPLDVLLFRCGLCDYTCETREQVDTHIQTAHLLTVAEDSNIVDEQQPQTLILMPSESGQRVLVDSSLPEASAVSAAGVLVSSSLSSGPSLGTLREDEQQPVQMLLSLAQPPDGDTMETHSVQNTDHEFLEPQLKTAEEGGSNDALYLDAASNVEVEVADGDLVVTSMEDQLTGTAEHDIQHDFYDVETTNLHGLDSEPAPLTDEANELATVDINAEELPCDSSNLQLDVTPKEEPLLDVTSGPVQVLVGGSTNDSESVSADVMTLPVDTQQLVCTEDSVDIEGQFSVGHPSDDQDLSNEVSSEIVHQPDVTQSDNLLIADDKEEKQDITLVVASLNEGSEMQSISIEEVEEQGVATEEQEGLSASEEAELAEEPSSLAATSSQDGEEDVDANMTKLNRDAVIALQQLIDLRETSDKVQGRQPGDGEVTKDASLHSCPVCHHCFNNHNLLRLHLRSHTGERPHHCTQCNKSFTSKDNLSKHVLSHSEERQFKCGECGKLFKRITHVREHLKIHTNERPYTCTVCGKAFKAANTCKVHMRTHTDNLPWRCSICQRMFREKASLERHMRTHTGAKPFTCIHCGRCFAEHGTLNRHLKAKVPCTRELMLQRDQQAELPRVNTDTEPFVIEPTPEDHVEASDTTQYVVLTEEGAQNIEIVSEEQAQNLQNANFVLLNPEQLALVGQGGLPLLTADHASLLDGQQLEEVPSGTEGTSLEEEAARAVAMMPGANKDGLVTLVAMDGGQVEVVSGDAVQQALLVANMVQS